MNDTQRPLAIVTGASNGIGLELARQFAQRDHDLLIVAQHQDGLDRAIRELSATGAHITGIAADLATAEGVHAVVNGLTAERRPVAALALNAGVGQGGSFVEGMPEATALADELRLIQLNVTSVVHLAKHLLPAMRERGEGRLLFTSSISGTTPVPFEAVYGASKPFVRSFANALRSELEGTGVSVTVLMPGPTQTNFFHRADEDDTQVGAGDKADPAQVARQGIDALMRGDAEVYGGGDEVRHEGEVLNRTQSEEEKAARHKGMSAPGSASPR